MIWYLLVQYFHCKKNIADFSFINFSVYLKGIVLAVLALLAIVFTVKKGVFLNLLSPLNLSRLIVLPAKK